MSSEINLLNTRRQGNVALQAKVKLLRLIAVGILFLVGVGSLVIFLLVLASPLPDLKKQETTLLNSLSQMHTKVLKQVLISTRLVDINKILSSRLDVDTRISQIRDKMPDGVSIEEVRVDTKEINIVFNSVTLGGIENISSVVKTMSQNDKSIAKVHIDSVDYTPGTPYKASYKITLH